MVFNIKTAKFEKAQLYAVRMITVHIRINSTEAVVSKKPMSVREKEVNVPSLSYCYKSMSFQKADDRAHLAPTDDIRQLPHQDS